MDSDSVESELSLNVVSELEVSEILESLRSLAVESLWLVVL